MKIEYVRQSSGRLFQNSFLEACSKVRPATPLFVYAPLVIGLLGWGLISGTTTLGWTALFYPLGCLTWLLMEFAIHRYFFHWEGSGPFTRKVHEIAHGYHHRYPDDADRLVMPLGASIPLAILVGGALWLVGRPAATLPFFCGIVSAYLFYDLTHWALHHHQPRTAWGKALRAHHMAHHFACPDRNFGISNRWIDRLFGTLRRRDVEGRPSP